MATDKKKIAVLGGGVGAMVAAFELTDYPNWQDNYEITLYVSGWRLGGKGANGRDPSRGFRIQEHGLHMWFGFYENAFHVLRKAYAEVGAQGLAPGSPFQNWGDAFTSGSVTTMMEQTPQGWQQWTIEWPQNTEVPGDEKVFLNPEEPATPWDLVVKLTAFLFDQWVKLRPGVSPTAPA